MGRLALRGGGAGRGGEERRLKTGRVGPNAVWSVPVGGRTKLDAATREDGESPGLESPVGSCM